MKKNVVITNLENIFLQCRILAKWSNM